MARARRPRAVIFDAIAFSLALVLGVVTNAPAERITFIEQKNGFGIDEGGASNCGRDFPGRAVKPAETTGERAAENAFLNPRFAFLKFFVGGEAGKFGAGAGAARRTVEGFARALNKIARMRSGNCRRAEKFDVIHFGKTLVVDGLADSPAIFSELLSVREG